MKQGRSLSALAQELERQQHSKKDFIADTRDLEMLIAEGGESRIIVPQQGAYPIRHVAHQQIGQRVGIPAKYYEKCLAEAPELLADNVNTWFKKNPERRMVRTLDGQMRSFLSDRYARIDNYDVANTVLPILKEVGKLNIVSCEVTERHMFIKATSSDLVLPVKGSRRVGDLVEAGVMVSNSEIGLGATSVKPFMNFLACTNGMVRDAVLRAAHLGRKRDENVEGLLSDQTKQAEDSVVLMKVRDVLKAAFDAAEFQKAIDRMSEQTSQRIEGDPVKAIEVLGNNAALTKDEQSSVLRHLIDGGDLSRYGLMNAVTRSAADVDDYDRATELETVGGLVLDLPSNDWKRIAEAA